MLSQRESGNGCPASQRQSTCLTSMSEHQMNPRRVLTAGSVDDAHQRVIYVVANDAEAR